MNSNLKIIQSKDHGRHCLATRNITKKSIIITGEPYAFAFTRVASRRTCAYTLDSFSTPLQIGCPDCKEVWYEEADFQKYAFRFHHLECKAFQMIHLSKYNTSYKMLLKIMTRAVIRKAIENGLDPSHSGIPVKAKQAPWLLEKEIPEWLKDKQKWKDFEALVSNRSSYTKRNFKTRLRMADDLIQYIPKIILEKAFPKEYNKPELVEYLAECICRYECNCFGYFNPDNGDQIGAAIIPAISFINHSCAPNGKTVYYFNGGPITVEATRDILKGEEVNISYCNENKGKKERQEYLKQYYHFDCACPKCQKVK